METKKTSCGVTYMLVDAGLFRTDYQYYAAVVEDDGAVVLSLGFANAVMAESYWNKGADFIHDYIEKALAKSGVSTASKRQSLYDQDSWDDYNENAVWDENTQSYINPNQSYNTTRSRYSRNYYTPPPKKDKGSSSFSQLSSKSITDEVNKEKKKGK